MVSLVGYYDASGHPDDSVVLTVGGYISGDRKWTRFDREWAAILADIGLDEFHMTQFMRDPRWEGRRDEILGRFLAVIRKNVRKSLATMIDIRDWNAVNEVYALERSRCTPYALCGFLTLQKALLFLTSRKEPSRMISLFEDGDKHKGDFIWVMDRIAKLDWRLKGIKPHFAGKDLTPLQAADFVMWEQSKLSKTHIAAAGKPFEVRPTFSELLNIPHEWGWMEKDDIIKFCVEFEVPKVGEAREWDPLCVLRGQPAGLE